MESIAQIDDLKFAKGSSNDTPLFVVLCCLEQVEEEEEGEEEGEEQEKKERRRRVRLSEADALSCFFLH